MRTEELTVEDIEVEDIEVEDIEVEDIEVDEPKMELCEGDFDIGEFSELMFEKWLDEQKIMNIEDEKVREIYDTGFAVCRMFFEQAVFPHLIKKLNH